MVIILIVIFNLLSKTCTTTGRTSNAPPAGALDQGAQATLQVGHVVQHLGEENVSCSDYCRMFIGDQADHFRQKGGLQAHFVVDAEVSIVRVNLKSCIIFNFTTIIGDKIIMAILESE